MDAAEVIKRVKAYRDYYGFDLIDTENLKTKADCKEVLEEHKKWLEDTLSDALRNVDDFISQLGIEYD